MRERARVQLIGEVTGVGRSKVQAYFELRDGEGAVPCAIWLNDLEKAGLPEGGAARRRRSRDRRRPRLLPRRRPGLAQLQLPRHPRAAGRRGRPARPARGAAQAAARRGPVRAAEAAAAAGCCRRRSASSPPRRGAARRDLLAGLERRGWARRRVVWAFAPVQDRHAAPAIAAAIQDLAARPEVEAIVVTRGGGSLADLWAFCDETLCRTVAMLRVPVVSAVGHERDCDPDRRRRRGRLLDPDPRGRGGGAARLPGGAARASSAAPPALRRAGEGAIGARARHLGALARGPARALQRERGDAQPEDPRDPRRLRTRPRRARRLRSGGSATVVLRAGAPARAAGADMEQTAATALRRAAVAAPRPRARAHPGARLRPGRGRRAASR